MNLQIRQREIRAKRSLLTTVWTNWIIDFNTFNLSRNLIHLDLFRSVCGYWPLFSWTIQIQTKLNAASHTYIKICKCIVFKYPNHASSGQWNERARNTKQKKSSTRSAYKRMRAKRLKIEDGLRGGRKFKGSNGDANDEWRQRAA